MKKVQLGVLLGVCAGIIDLIPMLVQKLSWDANLSAFSLWVVSGFFIAASDIRIKGLLKGVIISFLVLSPSAILIGWKEPFSLIPIFIMTSLLGSSIGFLVEKYGK